MNHDVEWPSPHWETMSTMQRTRTLLRATGMTRTALAELLGVGHSAVSRWSTGDRDTDATVRALLDLIGDPDLGPRVMAWLTARALKRAGKANVMSDLSESGGPPTTADRETAP